MNHITTKALTYPDHREELKFLAEVMQLMLQGEMTKANRLLVQRHNELIMAQEPRVVDYTPELESPR